MIIPKGNLARELMLEEVSDNRARDEVAKLEVNDSIKTFTATNFDVTAKKAAGQQKPGDSFIHNPENESEEQTSTMMTII